MNHLVIHDSVIHYPKCSRNLRAFSSSCPFHPRARVWYPAHRSASGEGSAGEWRRDKLQTDKFLQRPFPPRAPLFMAPTEPHKSDTGSPQPSAGIIVLHGQVHPLSSMSQRRADVAGCRIGDECLITASREGKE